MLSVNFDRGVVATSNWGAHFTLQIGTWVLRFGHKDGPGRRLEILTPHHLLRYCNGSIKIKYRSKWG